jgi:hypothetical protein
VEDLEHSPQWKKNNCIRHLVMRNHTNLHQISLLEMVGELGTVTHTAPITTTGTIPVDILADNYREEEGVIAVPISSLGRED